MAEPLLAIADLRAGYGSAVVLDDVSLDLGSQGGLAVLGRNGVGKSTLLLTIMGYTRVSRGRILWRGADITHASPHRRARAGIGWAAQEREIFSTLTVEENLTVAARTGPWSLPRVYELFPRLAERVNAFVLVEQHVEIALPLTETVIVLERGRIVHRGRSAQLLADHAALERLIGLRLADA